MKSNKTLLLLDDESSVKHDGVVAYWSKLLVPEGCISIPLEVDQHGNSLRDKYLSSLFNFGQSLINGRTVTEHFQIRDRFSLWWMSLLVEKSPWKSQDVFSTFKGMALDSILKRHEINHVNVHTSDPALISFLKSWANEGRSVCVHLSKAKPGVSFIEKLPHVVQAVAFLVRFIVKNLAAFKRRPFSNQREMMEDTINVFGYSDNLDATQIEKGALRSAYWGELHEYLESNPCNTNWIMQFTETAIMPDLSSGLEIIDNNLANQKCGHRYAFLEEWLSLKVTVKALKDYLKVTWRSFRLGKLDTRFKTTQSTPLHAFMTKDWLSSTRGKVAMENCLKLALFEAVTEQLGQQKKGLYVLENQGWERALNYFWKQNCHGELVGFQHVSGRDFDLRLFNDSRCFSIARPPLPEPDVLAVTGKIAKKVMLETGYHCDNIEVVEALRYQYLLNQPDGLLVESGNSLLVVTDYIPQVTEFQLRLLNAALAKAELSFDKVIIKPHPNCPLEEILTSINVSFEFEVVDKPLSLLWEASSVAYISNTTGAALEAAIKGVPVVISLDESSFNMSPLRGIAGVKFAGNVQQLISGLKEKTRVNIPDGYFCLQRPLQFWPALLEKKLND